MKTNKNILFIYVSQVLMRFLVFHSLFCLIQCFSYDSFVVYTLGILMIVPCALFSYSRKKINNFFVFTLIHAIILLFAVLSKNAALVITVAVAAVDSFYTRINKKDEFRNNIHIGFAALFVIVYIIGVSFEKDALPDFCFWESIIFILFQLIRTGLFKTEEFIKDNETSANLPVEQIKRSNRAFLSLFSVFVVIAIMLFQLVNTQPFIDAIKDRLNVKLIYQVPDYNSDTKDTQKPVEEEDEPFLPSELNNKPSVFALILEKIAIILVYVALIIGILFLVGFLMIKLFKRFNAVKVNEGDSIEFLSSKDVSEKTGSITSALKSRFTRSTNNEKIRKMYKKYVVKNTPKNEIPTSFTIGDISRKYSIGSIEINSIYENARYGYSKTEKTDVDNYRKIIKGNNDK